MVILAAFVFKLAMPMYDDVPTKPIFGYIKSIICTIELGPRRLLVGHRRNDAGFALGKGEIQSGHGESNQKGIEKGK